MAPGAKWIACRNMDAGDGTPARYIECMEFFLAPYPVTGTPAQGDPSKAPHVTTNSWSCPPRRRLLAWFTPSSGGSTTRRRHHVRGRGTK